MSTRSGNLKANFTCLKVLFTCRGQCGYSFPDETLSDINRVRSVYRDLRMYTQFYCFPNKEKKKLVYLAGTIPVSYDGGDYNIPVCMWIHETHPVNRPRCFVCPSVTMMINPSCPCVDSSGHVKLPGLTNWTRGASSLTLLLTEMRLAFQKDTPLYATPLASDQTPPPPAHGARAERSDRQGGGGTEASPHHLTSSPPPPSLSSSSSSSYLKSRRSSQPAVERGPSSQWEQGRLRRSYAEELRGIDFSCTSSSSTNPFLSANCTVSSAGGDTLSSLFSNMQLDSTVNTTQDPACHQSEATKSTKPRPSQPIGQDRCQGALLPPAGLSGDKAAMFVHLLNLKRRSFSPAEVLEAVQSSKDLQSAVKFLSHDCPICQEQVSFSKMVKMTHCSCSVCEQCFKVYFSTAVKEKTVTQMNCPLCSQPDLTHNTALEDKMEYYNLLDTQIRHYLSSDLHELYQRKLRDHALTSMDNFTWCAHCSFGVLHEADRLRMDCPVCKKSTCSHCRAAWVPQHEGLTCDQFDQLDKPHHAHTGLELVLKRNKIVCPRCSFVFLLLRGGCLHYRCSQCHYDFCGGCGGGFTVGEACGFSVDCGILGLHAHHPRNCLYHLRDWSIDRLHTLLQTVDGSICKLWRQQSGHARLTTDSHTLLQYYRVPPTWLLSANGSSDENVPPAVCSVMEHRDAFYTEEPCGRPALPQHRGYCQFHYKEVVVELLNQAQADPVVLFDESEMLSELHRWNVTAPQPGPQEPQPLYAHRLRLVVTQNIPLNHSSSQVNVRGDLRPLTSSAPRPHPPHSAPLNYYETDSD